MEKRQNKRDNPHINGTPASSGILNDSQGICGGVSPERGLRRRKQKKLKNRIHATVLRYLIITLGCFSLGAGIALFLDPNRIAPGGITGIAIILNKFLPVNTGLLILILNVPLLIFGFIQFGKRFIFSTVYATLVLSAATDLAAFIAAQFDVQAVTDDIFLAALFGGILSAVGLGLVFRCQCTTGGLDIAVSFIHKKWRHLGVGKIFLLLDFLIAGISAIVFKDADVGLYACVSIIVYSALMDVIIYGGNGAKVIYIVSNTPERIKSRLLSELEIGATDIEGVGGYTGERKTILMVAVKKLLYPRLRDIVREEDPSAFMIVSDAQEVYGLGFRSHLEDV